MWVTIMCLHAQTKQFVLFLKMYLWLAANINMKH
jgi:hypothetical protein